MKVWRLEKDLPNVEDRLGIFSSHFWEPSDYRLGTSLLSDEEFREINAVIDQHPNPFEDGIELDKDYKSYFCGFKNINEYFWWFPAKLRKAFDTTMTRLCLYDVLDEYVKVGGHQVTFKRSKAKLLKVFEPSTSKKELEAFVVEEDMNEVVEHMSDDLAQTVDDDVAFAGLKWIPDGFLEDK
jgi:hypothetical protein